MAADGVFDIGQVVSGRYRITRYLARGGMGEVYAAEDLDLRESVALKTLRPEISADTRSVSRFKQEIQLSRKVAHPNVCRVYDLARHPVDGPQESATLFLTMEFLAGENLESHIRENGAMPLVDALPLIAQIGAALDAAHENGIIHHDLKPSNVMLVPGGSSTRAVVTDFGLARAIAAAGSGEITQTQSGRIAGTPDYMAPELFTGAQASVASDVYAFGLTIYRMVTAAPPSHAKRQSAEAAPDARWSAAIRRAIDADPARRFASAGDLVRALRGESTSSGLAAGINRRRAIVGAATAAAGAAIWASWRIWSDRRGRPSAEALRLYQLGLDNLHAAAYFAATKALGKAVEIAPAFPLAHARLAEAWMELEETEQAAQAMLLARRGGTSGLSADERLQLEAIERSVTREFAKAAAKYEQMLKRAGAAKGDIYLDLGNTYAKAEQQPKALATYLLAVQHAPSNPAGWLRAAAQHSLASERTKAQEEFARAEELYRMTNNLEGLIELAYQRAVDALRRNQLEESAGHARKALEMATASDNVYQQIRAKLQLGSNAYLSGDAATAERYATEAIETAQARHIESLEVRGVLVLGSAWRRKREYGRAEKLYRDGLALARRNRLQRQTSAALLQLAGLHQQTGRNDEAVAEAREAATFYRQNNFARESCQCLVIIGRVQRDRGDPGALATLQECLQIAEKARDAYQMAIAHESLGVLLQAQEQFPKALEHRRLELELGASPARLGYAAAHCAESLWQIGQYDEALRMLATAERAGEKAPDVMATACLVRASLALSRRRFAEAAAAGRKGIELQPAGDDAALLQAILGRAQTRMGAMGEGRRNCQSALAAAEKAGSVMVLRETRLMAAEALLDSGDRAGAWAILQQADPGPAGPPHSRWRALALASRADPVRRAEHAAAARKQLDEIAGVWGEPVFRSYMTRPDVQELSRGLGRGVALNH